MTYKRANFGAAIARQQRRQGYHPRGGGSSEEAASHLAQTQHFCYKPPISRNQLIGKGFQPCHVS
jgi:hypothetical protein